MNASEAETRYHSIKTQLDAGQITLDDFHRGIAELRYLDNNGTWWAISPQDGSWLKWDGSVWVPGFAQAAPPAPQAAPPAPQPAVHPAVQQVAGTPSWYIPPVSSRQQAAAAKPAVDTAAAPAAPAAPSYYIPPAGSTLQKVQQPAGTAEPPAGTGTVKPARNWTGIISLVLALLSWLFYPYILATAALASGVYSLHSTRKTTGKTAVSALAGIVIGLASVISDSFWFVLFPPTGGFTLVYWLIR